ncbi:MAG: hypothetical protein ACLP7Q_02345, partial [Isosphaeraceae bacterium]
ELFSQVPLLAALTVVGLTLGGLIIGYQPVGDDPDLMYRPIKIELARALRSGTLPFWSDRFGMGMPLMAESHAAALYPLNWVFYGLLDVETAYRWLMWLHYVALAGTTYLLARDYKISPWGAAISSVSFTLCGFMAAHACHEPFYCLMPYLPLALFLARRFMATGGRSWQAGLALTLGAQLLLGHFQIQFWTIGLVVLFGATSAAAQPARLGRFMSLLVAVCWGLAIALPQLVLTAELTRYTTLQRPDSLLLEHGLPPAQLAQPAMPRLFIGDWWKPCVESNYWAVYQSSVTETCWYVGTIPLILAVIGFLGLGRSHLVGLWKLLIPVCLALACLPIAQPEAYLYVLRIPILGMFRAAGRYTLLASLAIAILAGSTVGQPTPHRRFQVGLLMACGLGLMAIVWGTYWSRSPIVANSLPAGSIPWSIGLSIVAWTVGLILVAAWRRGQLGPSVLFLATSLELAFLFYQAPVRWNWVGCWRIAESPILTKVVAEPEVGLIAGVEVNNLTVPLGIPPATPYLGILLPPPHYILRHQGSKQPVDKPELARWGRRFGVTHGIYRQWTKPAAGTETRLIADDPVLSDLTAQKYAMYRDATDLRWRLERYPGAFPPVRVLLRARVVADWPALFESLTKEDHRDEATYMKAGAPPQGQGPRASQAHLVSWNGTEAVVEHDGTCDVVFRRGWYPGWFFRTNKGPEQPVYQADGGLQAVRLYGSGPSKIQFRYRSPWWLISAPISLAASVGAIIVLFNELRPRRPQEVIKQNS